jgi:hypothetical protein
VSRSGILDDSTNLADSVGFSGESKSFTNSPNFVITLTFTGSNDFHGTTIFTKSTHYDSVGFVGSPALGVTVISESSHVVASQSVVSDEFILSNNLEASDDLHLSRAGTESSFSGSQAIPITSAHQPSINPVGSNEIPDTHLVTQTALFIATDDFANSRRGNPSDQLIVSKDFTASPFFYDGAAKVGRGVNTATSAVAATASVAGLACLAALTLFFVKRRKNQDVDIGMEYETEAHAVDLSASDAMDENDDEWDANVFDLAIESAFGQPSQVAYHTSDQMFSSDCDEIF